MPKIFAAVKLKLVKAMRQTIYGGRKFIWAGFWASVLTFVGVNFTPLYWINEKVKDDLLKQFRIKQHPDLVTVVIDDQTLRQLGRFPFDREVYAKLLDRLKEAGAKVVAFDILFIEPTPSDKIFSEAMKKFGKVILGVNLSQELRQNSGLEKQLKRLMIPLDFHIPLSVSGIMLPPKTLLEACFGIGFVFPFPDRDGVCRTLPLAVRLGKSKHVVPSLSLAATMAFFSKPKMKPDSVQWNNRKVSLGEDWDIPVLPPFSPSQFGFKSISFVRVLKGDFDRNSFKGKLVLVGMSASGLVDRLPTSTDPLAYGVEIHAAAINALLTGQSPIRTPLWLQFFIILAFSVPLGMCASFRQLYCLVISFLSAFFLAIVLSLLLVRLGFVMPLMPILISELLALFVAISLKAETQWRMFQPYLAKPVDEMLDAGSEKTRSVERREITVLFSDIRNFTAISASLTPYEVAMLLESFFNHMTEVVQIFGGVVDKFLGDGMMVLFGALSNQTDHAQRAVLCAWQMLEELNVVNWEWESATGSPLKIGIGVNTGISILGDIGSEWRKEFTALGLAVNLAQRLEELTKEVGSNLLIGEETYWQVSDLVIAEPLEFLVKGFEQPIVAYKVLGLTEKGKQIRRSILAARV